MIDHFLTINGEAQALYKEKSSKFYSYAFPVSSEEDVETELSQLKKLHVKARHFCYAYFLGAERLIFRANDDGEPSGTAGRPILGQLEKRNITNTLVVVVRYFGGTKLGVSGLIKAYKESAALALDEAKIVEELLTSRITVTCTYEEVGKLMSLISNLNLQIVETVYANEAKIIIEERNSEVKNTITSIKSRLLNRSIEDITDDTDIDNIEFSIDE